MPWPLVKIEDASGLDRELDIARKDPSAVLPRADRIRVEAAPDSAVGDTGGQSRTSRLVRHVLDRLDAEFKLGSRIQLNG